jgi:hypothetical protein
VQLRNAPFGELHGAIHKNERIEGKEMQAKIEQEERQAA